MSSVQIQKRTFNNWAKKIFDRLRNSVTKLVKMLIPGHTIHEPGHTIHESYLNEVIEIVKRLSINLANKQASGTNVSDNKITINWWLEDLKTYRDLKQMIGGYKIELASNDGEPSIIIIFRPFDHWKELKIAALRYLNPNLPRENHRAHDITLEQLIEDRDTFGKFQISDLFNNNLFYETSKKIIEDYIGRREIVPFSYEVYPWDKTIRKKVAKQKMLLFDKEYNSAAKSRQRNTDTREIFPNHKIFKQIDVLFQDSDGLNLDMIKETEKRFRKISDSNKSLFFCGQCGEYFELSGIPRWPVGFPTKKSQRPLENYQNHSGGTFERIVGQQKCPNGHSHPFIMRDNLDSSLSSVSNWFNWQYSLNKFEVTQLEKKIFNYNLLIDGNFESQIKIPPTVMNPLDYSNWDVRIVILFQEMYRPIVPLTHVHNNKCITNQRWFINSILTLKNDWETSNFQFVIDKMNEKNSTAIDIDPEDYSKISNYPKQKCNFNWHELGIGIYEGKGGKHPVCQCQDGEDSPKETWRLDENKYKYVCTNCGEISRGIRKGTYSKLRDINQPFKIKYILLGDE